MDCRIFVILTRIQIYITKSIVRRFLQYEVLGECGYLIVHDTARRVNGELYGSNEFTFLPRYSYFKNGTENATLIPFVGRHIRGPYNPCHISRGEYGPHYLKHAEHWRILQQDGWENYKYNGYKPCHWPGFHGCLNQYLIDGDLQFKDLYV